MILNSSKKLDFLQQSELVKQNLLANTESINIF